MPSHLITKNDTYALLIAEGIKRGFIVVPEFRVRIPSGQQSQIVAEMSKGPSKEIDLVWLERKPNTQLFQNSFWPQQWSIAAAFEIDGCNVPKSKEFKRHIDDLPKIHMRGKFHPERFVFLYTAAFDRSALNRKDWDKDIDERSQIANSKSNVKVLTAGKLGWQIHLPK